jgi:hypothetical protein
MMWKKRHKIMKRERAEHDEQVEQESAETVTSGECQICLDAYGSAKCTEPEKHQKKSASE